MHYENTLAFAQDLDQQDPLRHYRDQFLFPQHQGKAVLYFCGNSLGLQPKSVRPALLAELDQWETHGVEGHFRGELPWMHYHKYLTQQSARLVGALPHEVVVMNTLTVNLHLMMASFYRPTRERYKIVMEAGAFPSDQYAMESQVRWHGFDPADAIVEVAPRETPPRPSPKREGDVEGAASPSLLGEGRGGVSPGEETGVSNHILQTNDILEAIERETGGTIDRRHLRTLQRRIRAWRDAQRVLEPARRVERLREMFARLGLNSVVRSLDGVGSIEAEALLGLVEQGLIDEAPATAKAG